MKKIILFTFISVFLFSCGSQEPNALDSAKTDKFASDMQSESRPKGAIPSDIGLDEIGLEPTHHTWQDLDRFYKKVVLNTPKEKDYYSNLKNKTFFYLIEGYKINEKADLETVEFYINEQVNTYYLVQPQSLSKCLARMKGHWTDERISNTYNKVRQTQLTNIQDKFSNNPDFIKKKSEEYNKYLVFEKD